MATLSEAGENVTMSWINLEASTLKVEVWVCSRETMPKENSEIVARSHSERRYGAAIVVEGKPQNLLRESER